MLDHNGYAKGRAFSRREGKHRCRPIPISLGVLVGTFSAIAAEPATSPENRLRLVPFPKQIQLTEGVMPIGREPFIGFVATLTVSQAAAELREELIRAGDTKATLFPTPGATGTHSVFLWLSAEKMSPDRLRGALPPPPEHAEGYALTVAMEHAVITGRDEAGLLHGIQTLRQLIRANLKNRSLPCLRITDWPSLRYRGYSDDITRGPSPKWLTLEEEIRTTALLKMNFFSYYLEYQYAFSKHPLIGPKDGSLTPNELKALVQYAKLRGVEIIGNQQSFGHFGVILGLDAYKNLRETPDILNPTIEGTYQLLDDLYSEQAPLLESKLFNVCCDETDGLGTGPSKPLAEKIGVGGVYTNHIRRIHNVLRDKYGKRMMMWGDIILRHPEHLPKIPKDTIMLSWGYDPRPSWDNAITPFSKSGYEFFVCPGVSCWSRILPDFEVAVTNIKNYVRDGLKHGALGMWNTTWDDDGENFFAANWHGLAWGAECAWNGSTTSVEDFNRRVGAVLFGESGDRFGQAIALLGKTHHLPNYGSMFDSRFWAVDQDMGRLPVDEPTARKHAHALLDLLDPAMGHLKALKAEAKVNGEWIDYFLFGAERMRLMATRALAYLDAARIYEQACLNASEPAKASSFVQQAEAKVRRIQNEHVALKQQYVDLWNRESKPYALDRVTKRFDALIGRYAKIVSDLQAAAEVLKSGQSPPPAGAVGLELVETGVRRTRPARVLREPLRPDLPWAISDFKKRIGITVLAGDRPRLDLPIEVDLPILANPREVIYTTELDASTGSQTPRPCQIQRTGNQSRLAFVLTGPTPRQGRRNFMIYFDAQSLDLKQAGPIVRCSDGPNGAKWIENDRLRLLVGPEGAHIYRWEVKALNGRDITQPGEADWAGFADIYGPHRNAKNRIEVLANGPAMVRLKCTDETGLEKVITAYAGLPWVEVCMGSGQSWFWCYDDITLMGAESPTPGSFLFSDGHTGKVRKTSGTSECQERRNGVHWGAKFVPGGPLLAVITPEVAGLHVVGPGGGMGGVGVEGSPPASHVIIYGELCPSSPKDTLDQLRVGLDYRSQPAIEVYAVQSR